MKSLRLLCDIILVLMKLHFLLSSTTTGTAASGSHTSSVSSQPTKDNSSSELITISSDCSYSFLASWLVECS